MSEEKDIIKIYVCKVCGFKTEKAGLMRCPVCSKKRREENNKELNNHERKY